MGDINQRCREWLTKIGCPHSLSGINYVCDAVQKIYSDPMRSYSLVKDVYAEIGNKYDIKPFTVAQQINYFIKKAYEMSVFKSANFKCYIAPNAKTPSNREFLYAIADYLRTQKKEEFNYEEYEIENW